MTDIEGSTRLAARLGDDFAGVLDDHFRLIDAAIAGHDGTLVSSEGDAVFAVFASARAAIEAAVEAQRAVAEHNWPSGEQLKVRMGAHAGEALLGGRDYTGLEVHRAARIAAAAWGGQILVSDAVRALSATLGEDISLLDLGLHQLRALPAPELLFQVCATGLPSDFPPPRADRLTAPTNLPTPATRFVGRRHELAQVRELIGRERLVMLIGPGGTGKTRLAIETGRATLDEFSDGVWFVGLDTVRDPSLVLSSIAQVMNVPEQPGRPLGAVIGERLAKAKTLLVLDNLEQVVAAGPDIGSLLGATENLRILGSSRQALRIGFEHVYQVAPLAIPAEPGKPTAADVRDLDSVALFIERARSVRSDFELTDSNAPDVAAICRRVDGLPLAIELAASRVNLLAPGQILARLDHRLTMLASSRRDLPDRQRTLRGAIDWSHELLDPGEQALFRRTSVFAGGADFDGLQAVVDPDGDLGADLLDVLSGLVDRSLIRSLQAGESSRFEMLETIREYAAEKLAESAEEEVTRQRHAAYFAAMADSSSDVLTRPDRDEVLDRLDAELANLREAVRWSLAAGELDYCQRILVELSAFWHTRGHLAEARAGLDRMIEAASAPEFARQRARALGVAAELSSWATDYPAARRLTDQWIEAIEATGDRHELGRAKIMVGWSNVHDRPEVGAAAFREARAIALEFDDPVTLSVANQGLSLALLHFGEDDEAEQLALEAIAATERSGDRYGQSFNFLTVGVVAMRRGDLAGAAANFGESLTRSREAHADIGTLIALDAVSQLSLAMGNAFNAARLSALAERVRRDLGGAPGLTLAGLIDPLDSARREMQPDEFERAAADGAAMSLDAGVELSYSILATAQQSDQQLTSPSAKSSS